MEVSAKTNSIRISPRKVRLVADAVRKLPINRALQALQTTDKRAGDALAKTLKSAVANAVQNNQLNQDNLVIKQILVTEGQALKRFHPSTRGRVHPYKKRSSHITVTVMENKKGEKVSR